MTPLAKLLFAFLSVAIVIAGTIALRTRPSPSPAGRLTPAQLSEMTPAPKPEPPRAISPKVNDPSDLPPPPDDEPEVEDGNGS